MPSVVVLLDSWGLLLSKARESTCGGGGQLRNVPGSRSTLPVVHGRWCFELLRLHGQLNLGGLGADGGACFPRTLRGSSLGSIQLVDWENAIIIPQQCLMGV